MLGTFRDKILSWGAKILFGLLIVSFGLWGIGDYNISGSSGNDAVAEVGNRAITGRELETQVQNAMSRMRRLLGPEFTDEQARAMGLIDQTLNTLVQQNIFLAGAEAAGLIVNDELLGQAIRDEDQFKSGGQFNRNAFFQALHNAGLSEAAYTKLYRGQLLQTQLLSSIDVGLAVPASLTDTVYRYRNEQRVAEVIRLDHTKFTNIPTPDAATLANFHEENARIFTAPEYRALTVVLLQPEDVADEVDVPEQRIQDEYDSRINEFTQLERREIQQILVSEEAKAKKISNRLALGEDLAKVAKEEANLGDAELNLGELTKQQLPIPELADAAFLLASGTSSQPIKTALGWHILKVGKVTPGSQKTFAEVRDQVKRAVQLDLAADALVSLANKFEDDLGSGSTLEEAARRLNLKVVKVASMDPRGLDDAAKPIPNISTNREILRAAFETEEGQDSVLTDFGTASFFILRVDKVTQPTLRPLDKIRDGVAAAWKREQQANVAEKRMGELVDQLKGGKSLKAVADSMKVTIIETKAFTRTGQGLETEIPGQLVQDLFAAKERVALSGPGSGAHFIARVREIKAASAGADETGMASVRKKISQDIRNDLSEQLANAFRERIGVTINRDAIDNYFSPDGSRRTPRPAM